MNLPCLGTFKIDTKSKIWIFWRFINLRFVKCIQIAEIHNLKKDSNVAEESLSYLKIIKIINIFKSKMITSGTRSCTLNSLIAVRFYWNVFFLLFVVNYGLAKSNILILLTVNQARLPPLIQVLYCQKGMKGGHSYVITRNDIKNDIHKFLYPNCYPK